MSFPIDRPDKDGKFSQTYTMYSAKKIAQLKKRQEEEAERTKYLGEPPVTASLVQCRLVLPSGHRLPIGLDDMSAFDDVRRTHATWITRDETTPNVIYLHNASQPRLQEALKATNWVIHGMRLSNDHPTIRYYVQPATKASGEGKIKIIQGQEEGRGRPVHQDIPLVFRATAETSRDTLKFVKKLTDQLVPASKVLMAVNKELTLAVNFGKLSVRAKKSKEMSYDDLGALVSKYSMRGGAKLATEFDDMMLAESLVSSLVDSQHGILSDEHAVQYGCMLVMNTPNTNISAEINAKDTDKPHLSIFYASQPEAHARLDWVVSCPDMTFDWELRADGSNNAQISSNHDRLIRGITFQLRAIDNVGVMPFRPLQMTLPQGDHPEDIEKTSLRNTVTIKFEDTPWEVEVSVTRSWQGLAIYGQPTVTWGVRVYGTHWEEKINELSSSTSCKDWGDDLQSVFPGNKSESLRQRFGGFLECVMKVQEFLEDLGATEHDLI